MKKHSNLFRFFLTIVRLKNYLTEAIPRARRRLVAFLVFLLLSTILWLFRALDEPYSATINYPIEFINLPSNKMLTTAPPDHITLYVRGNGYTILNNKITSPILTLDVNNFSFYTQSNGILSVYLTSQLAKDLLTQELNKGKHRLEIIKIIPDTIYFNFSKTQNKAFPIRIIFNEPENVLASQRILNGSIRLKPDSIMVTAPSTITDTLTYIYTKPLKVSKLKDSVTKKVGLVPLKGAYYNVSKVEVLIPVDRYTETKFEVPLLIKNVPNNVNLVTFPRNVTLTFLIALSNLNKISKTEFQPYVDFNDIKQENSGELKLVVHTETFPSYAQKILVNPEKVDYLIEYNNASDRNNRGNR